MLYNKSWVKKMDKIDLGLLHSNAVDEIKLDEDVIFPSEVYSNTDVKRFNFVHVNGSIKRLTDSDDQLSLDVVGEMVLLDAISLEEVNYPFSCKIEGNLTEILGNCPNSLDILAVLWENIVLEIPLKFTKVEDLSKFHGDGWKVVSEDDATHKNNPFSELLKDL